MTVNYTIGLLPRESIDCSINSFGPGSCKGHFDFTLLFEQSILSILPSTLLLLLVPLRLYHLYGASTKTLPDPLQAVKSVSIIFHFSEKHDQSLIDTSSAHCARIRRHTTGIIGPMEFDHSL